MNITCTHSTMQFLPNSEMSQSEFEKLESEDILELVDNETILGQR